MLLCGLILNDHDICMEVPSLEEAVETPQSQCHPGFSDRCQGIIRSSRYSSVTRHQVLDDIRESKIVQLSLETQIYRGHPVKARPSLIDRLVKLSQIIQ